MSDRSPAEAVLANSMITELKSMSVELKDQQRRVRALEDANEFLASYATEALYESSMKDIFGTEGALAEEARRVFTKLHLLEFLLEGHDGYERWMSQLRSVPPLDHHRPSARLGSRRKG